MRKRSLHWRKQADTTRAQSLKLTFYIQVGLGGVSSMMGKVCAPQGTLMLTNKWHMSLVMRKQSETH